MTHPGYTHPSATCVTGYTVTQRYKAVTDTCVTEKMADLRRLRPISGPVTYPHTTFNKYRGKRDGKPGNPPMSVYADMRCRGFRRDVCNPPTFSKSGDIACGSIPEMSTRFGLSAGRHLDLMSCGSESSKTVWKRRRSPARQWSRDNTAGITGSVFRVALMSIASELRASRDWSRIVTDTPDLARISTALGQPVTRFTWRDGMARVTLATGRVVVGISEDKGEAWETVRGMVAR